VDEWFERNLICPRDLGPLKLQPDSLGCAAGHTYPCVDGIPVMLVEEAAPTGNICHQTLEAVREQTPESLATSRVVPSGVDPYAHGILVGTCGNLYAPLLNKTLSRYPIPWLRLPEGGGRSFLDVGCNWGRWSISAARKGYSVVGIDPNLEAIQAARRIASQLGVSIRYVVGDGRFLPFPSEFFDVAFSYGVLQHFSKRHAGDSLRAMARVMKADGTCLVQLPNRFGLLNLYRQITVGFNNEGLFEVRYWTPRELTRTFEEHVGPTTLSVDGYFTLNPQPADADLLPRRYRAILAVSELLRRLSNRSGLRWGRYLADSLYLQSTRPRPDGKATESRTAARRWGS
jgi:SAM-dependent methyltransferase/uncharacterized protein YbaR (Trm112 family)